MSITAALSIGSAVVSGLSSISKGRKQKRLAEERAEQKRLQRLEIQRRTESEIELLRAKANETVGFADTQYAGGGISVSSGAAVQSKMQSFENLGRVILNKRLESKFRDSQMSAEERWERKQGQSYQTSSVIDAFSGLLSVGDSIAEIGPVSSSSSSSSLDILGDSIMDAGYSNTGMEGIV